jgi:hypothetical protein
MQLIRPTAFSRSFCRILSLIMVSQFAPRLTSAAEDGDQPRSNAAAPQQAELKVGTPEKNTIPNALGVRRRTGSDMTLRGGQPTDNGSAPNGPREIVEFQKRMEELQKAQQQFASEYQKAMKELQESLPRTMQMDIKRQEAKQKLDAAQAEIAAISIAQSQGPGSPMPDNAALVAFPLKFVRPEEIGQALHNITGGSGPRIAVDERTNTLLIAGSPKQMDVAKQIVQTLDQPGKSQQGKVPQPVQVRIVWLSEGLTDRNMEPPKASVVSPKVADALRELGMELPQVVCQQLTSLTLDQPGQRGQFHFQVPAAIEDSTWQFQGQGTITPTTDDRYAMEFNLSLAEPGAANQPAQSCQLGGSILTPLGHYTVMGTTTFLSPAQQPATGKLQRLSAFVVYLDRPKDFDDADSSGASSKKSGIKRQ